MSLPKPDGTFEVTDAINPSVNGVVKFRYPSALTQIQIGTRQSELANFGRRIDINPDTLPREAGMFLKAVATLEYVITNAPEGWYQKDNRGAAFLSPGDIGNGDEGQVIAVWDAYLRFRNAVREGNRDAEPAKPDSEGVAQDSENDGGASE